MLESCRLVQSTSKAQQSNYLQQSVRSLRKTNKSASVTLSITISISVFDCRVSFFPAPPVLTRWNCFSVLHNLLSQPIIGWSNTFTTLCTSNELISALVCIIKTVISHRDTFYDKNCCKTKLERMENSARASIHFHYQQNNIFDPAARIVGSNRVIRKHFSTSLIPALWGNLKFQFRLNLRVQRRFSFIPAWADRLSLFISFLPMFHTISSNSISHGISHSCCCFRQIVFEKITIITNGITFARANKRRLTRRTRKIGENCRKLWDELFQFVTIC